MDQVLQNGSHETEASTAEDSVNPVLHDIKKEVKFTITNSCFSFLFSFSNYIQSMRKLSVICDLFLLKFSNYYISRSFQFQKY